MLATGVARHHLPFWHSAVQQQLAIRAAVTYCEALESSVVVKPLVLAGPGLRLTCAALSAWLMRSERELVADCCSLRPNCQGSVAGCVVILAYAMLALAAPRASLKPAPDATARSIASCKHNRHKRQCQTQKQGLMLAAGPPIANRTLHSSTRHNAVLHNQTYNYKLSSSLSAGRVLDLSPALR
jgi:hypothetical protein